MIDNHRLLVPLLVVGAVVRHRTSSSATSGGKMKGLWEKAKQGGAILARPRDYVVKVLLPSFGSWIAKLCVIGIFLAAYGDPRHVPHDHVGRRRQLTREHGLVHAGRRRHHPGREQRRAARA